jgi:hypothetical protein
MRSLLVGFVVLGIASFAAREPIATVADAGPPASLPACVQVKTESRYVPYGYNHLVTVMNGCTKSAACTVATDVNPEPKNIVVPASSSAEVTTFMGAASSTFTAKVSCQLR